MKKSLLLILLMLLVSSIGNTQSKYPYWSVNVTGGGTVPLGSFGDAYDFGGNAGVDVVYHIDQFWAVYGTELIISLSTKVQLHHLQQQVC